MSAKLDPTVPISGFLLIGWVAVGSAFGVDDALRLTADAPIHSRVFFWLVFAGLLRAAVLWFQTLFHTLTHAAPADRVRWTIGHALLWPVVPFLYYFTVVLRTRDVHGGASGS